MKRRGWVISIACMGLAVVLLFTQPWNGVTSSPSLEIPVDARRSETGSRSAREPVSSPEPIRIDETRSSLPAGAGSPESQGTERGTRLIVKLVDAHGSPVASGFAVCSFGNATPVEHAPDQGSISHAFSDGATQFLLPVVAQYAVVGAIAAGKGPSQQVLGPLRIIDGVILPESKVPVYEVSLVLSDAPGEADVFGTVFVDGAPRLPAGLRVVATGQRLRHALLDPASRTYCVIGANPPSSGLFATSEETLPLFVSLPPEEEGAVRQDLHCATGAPAVLRLVRKGVSAGDTAGMLVRAECSTPASTVGTTTLYLPYSLTASTGEQGTAVFRGLPADGSVVFVIPRSERFAHNVRAEFTMAEIDRSGRQVTIALDAYDLSCRISGEVPSAAEWKLADRQSPVVVRYAATYEDAVLGEYVAPSADGAWSFEVAAGTRCRIWAQQGKRRVSEIVELQAVASMDHVALWPLQEARLELRWRGAPPQTDLDVAFVESTGAWKRQSFSAIAAVGSESLQAAAASTMEVAFRHRDGVSFRTYGVPGEDPQGLDVELEFRSVTFTINGAPANGSLQLHSLESIKGTLSAGALVRVGGGVAAGPIALPSGRYLYKLDVPEMPGLILGVTDVAASPGATIALSWQGDLVPASAVFSGSGAAPGKIIVNECGGIRIGSVFEPLRTLQAPSDLRTGQPSIWFAPDQYVYERR